MQRLLDEPTTITTKLSYPGWRDDKAIAESLYCEYGPSSRRLQRKLIGMGNKQRLFDGDRSHPDIVALDTAKFTYPGWQEDRDAAEKIHTHDSVSCGLSSSSFLRSGSETLLFERKLHVMKKKQRMHSGKNRSKVRFLKHLDSFTFTYPGWRDDKAGAETLYCEDECSKRAQAKLIGMKNKQRLFDGDRSHPQIVALDSATFTYVGWQNDKEHAEKLHTATASWLSSFCETFEEKLSVMKKNQLVHSNRSSVAFIRELSSFTFTYPGWRDDKIQAENMFCDSASSRRARKKLIGMKNKQRLFEGDRSHPEIVALDSIVLSYTGWQEDKKEAERIHTVSASLSSETFEEKLCVMKRKQRTHSNRVSIRFLRHLDFMSSRRPPVVIRQSPPPDPKKKAPTQKQLSAAVQTEALHCVICWERVPSHAFIPCGHRCVCTGCALACTKSRQSGSALLCPVCRDNAMCVTKIFL